jgi:amino acid transporter
MVVMVILTVYNFKGRKNSMQPYYIILFLGVVLIVIITVVLASRKKIVGDPDPASMDIESWINNSQNADGSIQMQPEEELIAIITAAIAAQTGRHESQIRVKAFRRIPQDAPVWNSVGRLEKVWSKL